MNCEDEYMEYLTTKELLQKWNISQRRIQVYCKGKRIVGVILKEIHG